jgi:phage terminase small subunit
MITAKQQRFCEEYLIDLNGKQAAIRSGYSERTAEVQASRLLSKANVSARIAELKAARVERTEITADYVLTGLKEVAERCLQRVPVMEFNYEMKRMVQKTDSDDKGVWEFDSSGANRAFELLGKHVGVFEKDNSQKKPETVVNNVNGMATNELKQLNDLLSKVNGS